MTRLLISEVSSNVQKHILKNGPLPLRSVENSLNKVIKEQTYQQSEFKTRLCFFTPREPKLEVPSTSKTAISVNLDLAKELQETKMELSNV